MTTTELQGIVRFDFRGGDVEEFKRLAEQCMEIVQAKERGQTLQYDTYFNADETACVTLERFRDSQALIDHSENLAELMEPIMATASSVAGELLGDLSPELRAKMEGAPVGLFTLHSSM
jgi:quinol monooxygenase YgiN